MSDNGRVIDVTDHGTCLQQGTFDVGVFVNQRQGDTFAMGHSRGDCPDADPTQDDDWERESEARTLAPALDTFEEGVARVCAFAEVRSTVDGTVTAISKWWCKDVVLE